MATHTRPTREHSQASHTLTTALVALAARGHRPPCGTDPELWTSDNQADRLVAVVLCGSCPVIDACAQAADAHDESHGVWAGRDRTPPKGAGRNFAAQTATPAQSPEKIHRPRRNRAE